MTSGPRFDGAEQIPSGALKLLADKYTLKILEATLYQPRTAREIVRDFDLPSTTVYRRLDSLEEQNLINEEMRFDADGDHRKVYESNLEELHLGSNGEGYELTINLRQTSPDVWNQTWKKIRAGNND